MIITLLLVDIEEKKNRYFDFLDSLTFRVAFSKHHPDESLHHSNMDLL